MIITRCKEALKSQQVLAVLAGGRVQFEVSFVGLLMGTRIGGPWAALG